MYKKIDNEIIIYALCTKTWLTQRNANAMIVISK